MLPLMPDPVKQRVYKSRVAQFHPLHLFLNHVRSSPYLLYLPGYPIRPRSTRGILIGIDVVIDIVACFVDLPHLFRSVTRDHAGIVEYRLHGF